MLYVLGELNCVDGLNLSCTCTFMYNIYWAFLCIVYYMTVLSCLCPGEEVILCLYDTHLPQDEEGYRPLHHCAVRSVLLMASKQVRNFLKIIWTVLKWAGGFKIVLNIIFMRIHVQCVHFYTVNV